MTTESVSGMQERKEFKQLKWEYGEEVRILQVSKRIMLRQIVASQEEIKAIGNERKVDSETNTETS